MSGERIEVAAAVIVNSRGEFLLAQRPSGKVYAGYWEFPGGKIERGESPLHALGRELHEELGLELERAYPWLTRDYTYPHAAVRLRFFRVVGWSGKPHGKEDQRFAWQAPSALTVAPVLPANGPILQALELPPVYAISMAAGLGRREFVARLERALAGGLRLLQVREKSWPAGELEPFAAAVLERARAAGAKVLVNADVGIAQRSGADGVHLTSAQLAALERRPAVALCGASCHDATELARAVALELDFVVLGPVLPTPSHPAAVPLGWEKFASLIRDYPLPVYALGGMRRAHLDQAWKCGAHGVAMMRGAWED